MAKNAHILKSANANDEAINFIAPNVLYTQGLSKGYKEIYTPKLTKFDLTTDAEYVANLAKGQFNMWL